MCFLLKHCKLLHTATPVAKQALIGLFSVCVLVPYRVPVVWPVQLRPASSSDCPFDMVQTSMSIGTTSPNANWASSCYSYNQIPFCGSGLRQRFTTFSVSDTSQRGWEIRKVDSDYISCSISFAHPKDSFVLGLLSNMSEIVSGFKFTGDLYWNLTLQCGSCNEAEMSFKCHLVIREIWRNEKMWN